MPQNPSIQELIDEELDKQYLEAIEPLLREIYTLTSEMPPEFDQLDEEILELEEAGQPLTPDNESFSAAMIALQVMFEGVGLAIGTHAPSIEQTGINVGQATVPAKIFPEIAQKAIDAGINPVSNLALNYYRGALAEEGIPFVLDAANIADRYTSSPEWIKKMENWGPGYAERTKDILVNGIREGNSPKQIARDLRKYASDIPPHAADNLTRTLQLHSYREAKLEMEQVNGQFITKKIRIATLDQRTCLACIALHGTELKPGERVDDHYRGRCDDFYVVPGGDQEPPFMQADSKPGERNFVPYQKGEDWFASLPPERQRLQFDTPSKWRAYQDGIPLSEFVMDHHDPVFGHQFVEGSLLKSIGDKSLNYYTNPPTTQLQYLLSQTMSYSNQRKMSSSAERAYRILRSDSQKALKDYTGDTYRVINKSLRGKLKLSKYTQAQVDLIDEAMDHSPGLYGNATLYRGVKPDDSDFLDNLRKLKPGDTFSDPAYFSTSLSENTAKSFSRGALFEVKAPKGLKGFYTEPFSHYGGEDEFLIARGTEFLVENVYEGRYGELIITLVPRPARTKKAVTKSLDAVADALKVEGIALKGSKSQQAALSAALSKFPTKHTKYIQEIALDTGMSKVVLGSYDPYSQVIRLNASSWNEKVLAHEIGHSLAFKNQNKVGKAYRDIFQKFQQNPNFDRYGFTPYSISTYEEFIADSYKSFTVGSKKHQKNIRTLWKQHGLDIEEIFG